MASHSEEFPFGILDVVELLQLRVRRRSPEGVYTDCPICGDRRGKLHIHVGKNVWRCNYCQASGGMLALYGRVYDISASDAYREICDALRLDERPNRSYGIGSGDSARGPWTTHLDGSVPQAERASRQAIHQTYSVLLDLLPLRPAHAAHLTSEKRGLTEEQIEAFRFKSTPPPFLCHALTRKLLEKGCTVEGVPGFYQDKNGIWTMRFSTTTAEVLLPTVPFAFRGIDALHEAGYADIAPLLTPTNLATCSCLSCLSNRSCFNRTDRSTIMCIHLQCTF